MQVYVVLQVHINPQTDNPPPAYFINQRQTLMILSSKNLLRLFSTWLCKYAIPSIVMDMKTMVSCNNIKLWGYTSFVSLVALVLIRKMIFLAFPFLRPNEFRQELGMILNRSLRLPPPLPQGHMFSCPSETICLFTPVHKTKCLVYNVHCPQNCPCSFFLYSPKPDGVSHYIFGTIKAPDINNRLATAEEGKEHGQSRRQWP